MRKPLDKILCGGKFYRYVVACMHNCPRPHYCNELWQFFEAIGKTPPEYYNEDGIGERVMRRIVFDCDRCGKRDLLEVYGLYNLDGEDEVCRLDEVQRADMLLQAGHTGEHVTRISFIVLDELETAQEWQHYCRACFKDVADGVARMLKPPANRVRKRKKLTPARIAAKKGAAAATNAEDDVDLGGMELEVVVIPVPEPAPEPTPEPEPQPAEPVAPPAPKKRGRPRKTPDAAPKAKAKAKDKGKGKAKVKSKPKEEPPADEPKPKKRGRPRKQPTSRALKL